MKLLMGIWDWVKNNKELRKGKNFKIENYAILNEIRFI